ncbi:MAG: hypothetical protein WDA28_12825 [Castellaniella sp.]
MMGDEIERQDDEIWDIHYRPPVDRSIEEFEYHEYRNERNAVDANLDDGPKEIKFRFKDKDLLSLPSEAMFQFRFRITDQAGQPLAAGTNIAPVNDIGVRFWNQTLLTIDGKPHGQHADYAGLSAYVAGLLEQGKEYSETAASNMGWYKDTDQGNAALINGPYRRGLSTGAVTSGTSGFVNITAAGNGAPVRFKVTGGNGSLVVRNAADNANIADDQFIVPQVPANDFLTSPYEINKGHRKRYQWTHRNQFTCWVPLKRFFALFKEYDKIVTGRTLDISLIRKYSGNEHAHGLLLRDGGADACIRLFGASLWMPIVKPNPLTEAKLLSDLGSGTRLPFLYEDWAIEHVGVDFDQARTSHRYDCQFGINVPTKVFVFFQNRGRSTSQTANGGIFDHRNIREMMVEVNQLKYPATQLLTEFREYTAADPNTYESEWGRAYMQLLSLMPTAYPTAGPQISHREFKDLFPIFGFDLRRKNPQAWSATTSPRIAVTFRREADALGVFDMYVLCMYEKKGDFGAVNGKTVFDIGRA